MLPEKPQRDEEIIRMKRCLLAVANSEVRIIRQKKDGSPKINGKPNTSTNLCDTYFPKKWA
jgi:hypothetical protein